MLALGAILMRSCTSASGHRPSHRPHPPPSAKLRPPASGPWSVERGKRSEDQLYGAPEAGAAPSARAAQCAVSRAAAAAAAVAAAGPATTPVLREAPARKRALRALIACAPPEVEPSWTGFAPAAREAAAAAATVAREAAAVAAAAAAAAVAAAAVAAAAAAGGF